MKFFTDKLARALPLLLLASSSYAQLGVTLSVDYSTSCQRSITASVTGGSGNYRFNWGTDGTNPSCTTPPNSSTNRLDIPANICSSGGRYTVFVRDLSNNAVTYADIPVAKAVVGEFDILANNFATPNGDGINDTFDVSPNTAPYTGLMNAHTIYVEIVNRWGVMIHQSSRTKNDGGGLGGRIAIFDPSSYRGSVLYWYIRATNCSNGNRDYNGTLTVQ